MCMTAQACVLLLRREGSDLSPKAFIAIEGSEHNQETTRAMAVLKELHNTGTREEG